MTVTIGRRELLAAFGGAAAGWPLAARAQQGERVRRIGVLMNLASDDPEGQSRVTAFVQGLQQSGWSIGHNMRIDYRWGAGDAERFREHAAELLALAPDVIMVSGAAVVALQQITRTVPIVFVNVGRSGRTWPGRQSGTAGRERHRLYPVRIRQQRKVVGAAQGDGAARGTYQTTADQPAGCQ